MAIPVEPYRLKYPIVRTTRDSSGIERDEELQPAGFAVELSRPRARDMKMMDKYEGAPIAGALALLAATSNLTAEEIDLLDAEDMMHLGNALAAPGLSGPTNGLTS